MNVFQKAWKRLLEAGSFYRYLLVGVGTSLLDFSLFSLLSVGFDLPVVPSNITSTIITVCVSYWINQHFVFQAKRFFLRLVLLFCGINALHGNGPSICHHLDDCSRSSRSWAESFAVPLKPAAKAVAMGTGAVCNYLGYRLILPARSRYTSFQHIHTMPLEVP